MSLILFVNTNYTNTDTKRTEIRKIKLWCALRIERGSQLTYYRLFCLPKKFPWFIVVTNLFRLIFHILIRIDGKLYLSYKKSDSFLPKNVSGRIQIKNWAPSGPRIPNFITFIICRREFIPSKCHSNWGSSD